MFPSEPLAPLTWLLNGHLYAKSRIQSRYTSYVFAVDIFYINKEKIWQILMRESKRGIR